MNRIEFTKRALVEYPRYWWGDWLDARFYLRELISKQEGRVLDAGCGAGLLTLGLEGDFVGVDADAESLKAARSLNKKQKFVKASLYELPFKNNSFDCVAAANVLPGSDYKVIGSKKQKQKKFISELHRVLKPNGTLLFTTPNRAHYSYHKATAKATAKEVRALLSPYFEFELRSWNPFPPWPYWPPARVLARLPVYYELLKWLCERGWFKENGKTFIVRARKQSTK